MQINNLINKTAFLGRFYETAMEPGRNNELYGIIPSRENPRWIIPIDKKSLIIASFAIYQPSLLRSNLAKQSAIFLTKLGFLKMLVKDKLWFQKHDDVVRNIFDKENLNYAIFLGTPGRHCKITIQVMNEKGAILGYIKVSDNGEVDKLLDNEAAILQYLSTRDIRNGLFPRVLKKDKINNVNILALDSQKSISSTFSDKLNIAHITFLAELFNKTCQPIKFKESSFFGRLFKKIQSLPEDINSALKQTFMRAYSYIGEHMDDKIIWFGVCHRDFTPWNMFFDSDKLFIFDWEYAEKEYPPMLDIFHFILQHGIIIRRLDPKKLLRLIKSHNNLIRMYCNNINIDKNLSDFFLLCYLVDIGLFYIEREHGTIWHNIYKMEEIWSEMINLLMNNLQKGAT